MNACQSIAIANDKFLTMQCLARAGIRVPNTVLLPAPYDLNNLETIFHGPFVVKSLDGGSGKGVYLCNSQSEMRELLQFITCCGADKNLLIQEFIAENIGVDLRVESVGGKIVSVFKRTAKEGFKANVALGGSYTKIKPDEAMHDIVQAIYKAVPLDLCGVDLLITNKGYVVTEIN